MRLNEYVHNWRVLMASQERFELPTDGLEGRCSIQLSYWDKSYNHYFCSLEKIRSPYQKRGFFFQGHFLLYCANN